jgi:tRNA pseudouridine38-40 synthase
MVKYKLTIAYDGTRFAGWQTQSNGISIQATIEESLSTILRIPTEIIGSGRTDAGVHALGQVAHFVAEPTDLRRLLRSLNGILPTDIRVLHIEEVDEIFHARYSAISKEYHYHFHLSPIIDPFKRLYVTHFPIPLDIALLGATAKLFVGTHDFTSFANKGSSSKSPIRTVTRLDVCHVPHGIRLEFEGEGFLYKMVRNITGTLLDVARGKITPDDVLKIFAAKDRTKAPPAAPAQGLFLMRVQYPATIDKTTDLQSSTVDDLEDRSKELSQLQLL